MGTTEEKRIKHLEELLQLVRNEIKDISIPLVEPAQFTIVARRILKAITPIDAYGNDLTPLD